MNKIAMILPNAFPVPAIKGGAVETLATHLINENEKEKRLKLIIFSIWNEEAKLKSLEYENTDIHYIKVPFNTYIEKLKGKWIAFSKKMLERPNFIKKCLVYGILKIMNINSKIYIHKIYKELKKISFDYLIIEGGNIEYYYKTLKKISLNQKAVHLHSQTIPNRMLAENFQYYITVSEYVKRELVKDNMIEATRVKVLENCINIQDFNKEITKEERRNIRHSLGIREEDIVIIFCGRTVKEKGIKELIQAYKNLNKYENTKLLIVGNSQFGNQIKTTYDMELQELVNSIKENIIFTGFIANEEIFKMYQSADISVVPSIWEEAFGLVLIEAMQSKLPVITTNSGAIPEIVSNESAYIINRDEKMIENITNRLRELIEEPEKRKQMGKIGYQISQKYNTKRYYREFVEIIQEIDKNEDRNTDISKCP